MTKRKCRQCEDRQEVIQELEKLLEAAIKDVARRTGYIRDETTRANAAEKLLLQLLWTLEEEMGSSTMVHEVMDAMHPQWREDIALMKGRQRCL